MNEKTLDWQVRAQAAEKTVDVLKQKVLALYAGGNRNSLHRALELAKQREERNRQRREMTELRSAELAKHNAELELKVARRTHDIKVILDNVTCGFLRIDNTGNVQEGYSRSCEPLFGCTQEISGRNLTDLLGIDDAKHLSEFQMGIDQVFDDLMPEEVSLGQIPSRFIVGKRVLEAEGRLIRSDSGDPESILFTISDITALQQARKENREREVLIGILRQRVAFEHFVSDVRVLSRSARECIQDQCQVRRVVHTIKGNAGSWGLNEMASQAHAVEEHAEISSTDLDTIEDSLRRYLQSRVELSGISYDACEPAFDVPAAELRSLRRLIESPERLDEIEAWVAGLLNRPAEEFMGPIQTLATNLAARLEKPIHFEVRGADVAVDSEIVGPVLRDISHLIRNAIDHGIEPSGRRGEKSDRGQVSLSILQHEAGWTVEVEDDGRGIQVADLVERAVTLGTLTPQDADAMTDDERIALIFVHGLSTATSATEISGRGVGMSAVQEAVRRSGGAIQTRTGPTGTKFTIELPAVAALSGQPEGESSPKAAQVG